MSERLDEADHEIRSLLRFAAGLGVDDATVFEFYVAVREEAQASDITVEERMAEARRRLLRAA